MSVLEIVTAAVVEFREIWLAGGILGSVQFQTERLNISEPHLCRVVSLSKTHWRPIVPRK